MEVVEHPMNSSSGVVPQVKESARMPQNISHRDPLTGLPNRVLYDDCLQQAIRNARRHQQPLAVVSLELDGFKSINERHGRVVCDQVLATLAENMKRVLRKGDLLARLCGQEFAAVLHDLHDPHDSIPAITRLLDAVTEPVQIGNQVHYATASMGITFYPQAEELDAEQLLAQAVQAMQQAKRAGRNLYHFFDAAKLVPRPCEDDLLDRIRQAMEAGEFVLYYQPKVNMRAGKVVGVEALIRWHHPERGLLAPSEFLPVIEDHRLSVDLGEWAIETVLNQMEEWRAAGLQLVVSVNVSSHHLQQNNFPESLTAMLASHPSISPSSLELEILGSGTHQDAEQLAEVVRGCRHIGVSVALDDFGSGRSSLEDLKRLPANVLKIDSGFVRNILDSTEDLAILEGVLGLATAFRRQFIAEGVESPEHCLLLLRLGCDLVQGYGIARPMEAQDLLGWVAAWRPDPQWAVATSRGLDERLLVYTSVEHKAWIVSLEAYIKGELETEPRLNRHLCQLGAFVDATEQAGHNSQPAFQAIAALHWRIHAMAQGIVKLHTQGKSTEALARLADLQGLLENLLLQLKSFRLKN
jgi:diguanylate cyclase (GGDEF)-like protein